MNPDLPANTVIEALALSPHPEGGWYRETVRLDGEAGRRGACTSILFLLEADQVSHWHRVDAAEIWLHQGGGPLTLRTSLNGETQTVRLGPDPLAGEALQALVRPGEWQAAEAHGRWALVACVVAPAFDFAGFELAPPGWTPPGG